MSEKYPSEFWKWAREHGWPCRGPRGSEVNIIRKKMLPALIKQYRLELLEVADATR